MRAPKLPKPRKFRTRSRQSRSRQNRKSRKSRQSRNRQPRRKRHRRAEGPSASKLHASLRRGSLSLRPRGGGDWMFAGSALRVLGDQCLGNDAVDFLERSSAYPQCTAIGRELHQGMTRLVFEIEAEKSEGRFAQVGLALIQPDEAEAKDSPCKKLSDFTPLLASVFFTAAGDIFGTPGTEVLCPGDSGQVLCRRADDWWSGAPTWLLGGDVRRLKIFMEVDVTRSCVSFRLAKQDAPVVVAVPGLSAGWAPAVAITAGQRARILDLERLADS
ncbi:unnamed protein product [Effrenium voratum]|uniref:Uncharacterized protein n=1 Tax=Effrenium voratum TaxID=2562239 RepID=A0AA36MPZ8_9DINO|nr:unnamed protein product [Effrenium voratum]